MGHKRKKEHTTKATIMTLWRAGLAMGCKRVGFESEPVGFDSGTVYQIRF